MTEHPVYLVDANILLRHLTGDHPQHSPLAKKLFSEARVGHIRLHIPFIAITETIFTLQSFYGIERADIGRELLKLLTAPGVTLTCPGWVMEAIESFQTRNVSFGDACLAAEARTANIPIVSFDRGLEKFAGVRRYEPEV
jgi:predicted nucleic acid-binding protein